MPKVFNESELGESVVQFLERLEPSTEAALYEMHGRRVYFVVRPTSDASEHIPWSSSRNERRCDLIDKEIAGTITPEESIELIELQVQMRRFVDEVAPLPIATVRKLHAELLEKASHQTHES